MKRRAFLARVMAVAGVAGVAVSPPGLLGTPQGHAARFYNLSRLYRVGISSWSFHNYFSATRSASFSLPGSMLDLLDFPEMIADRYRVHGLEFVAPHFASTESHYLAGLNERLARSHSHLVNIPVDIPELEAGGGLSDPSPGIRSNAVNAVKKWINVARRLNARSVRADPGKININNLAPTIDSYRQLAAYGRSRGIYMLIENHQGAEPEEIAQVIHSVGGYFIAALPDFGNFPNEAARLAGLPLLFSHAITVCHAKGVSFDREGNETTFDFRKCIDIAKRARFRGVYSVEYEGAGDPYEGVQNVVNELIRYL